MWHDYNGRLMLDEEDIERVAEERGVAVEEVTQGMMDDYAEENT